MYRFALKLVIICHFRWMRTAMTALIFALSSQ
jgi:hypothetical protein